MSDPPTSCKIGSLSGFVSGFIASPKRTWHILGSLGLWTTALDGSVNLLENLARTLDFVHMNSDKMPKITTCRESETSCVIYDKQYYLINAAKPMMKYHKPSPSSHFGWYVYHPHVDLW